jgi:hypothetical protein
MIADSACMDSDPRRRATSNGPKRQTIDTARAMDVLPGEESKLRKVITGVAPQSGHVSNFSGTVDPLIEPADAYCFQSGWSAPPTLVHDGRPVWTRLELAWGAQNTFRMAREN